jgi:hypothetical protein
VARAAAAGRPRGNHAWLQGLACGALVTFAPSFALLFGALLAPTVMAVLLDRRPGRPVARAVFFAGLAMSLAPAWRLFQTGPTIAAALDLLAEPVVIAPAWLAGACGWALCELLPVLLRIASDANTGARVAALKAEAKALGEAWDI